MMLVNYAVIGAFAIISPAMMDRPGNIRGSMSVIKAHSQGEEAIVLEAAPSPSASIPGARVQKAIAPAPPSLAESLSTHLKALADKMSFGNLAFGAETSQELQPTEMVVKEGDEFTVSLDGAMLFELQGQYNPMLIGTVPKDTLVIAAAPAVRFVDRGDPEDLGWLPIKSGFLYWSFPSHGIAQSTGPLIMLRRHLKQADENSLRLAAALQAKMHEAKRLADERAQTKGTPDADDADSISE